MQQTKPLFLIKKYRSILSTAIVIEAINFIVSLTDSIIAGNAINEKAFAAIGLFAPFLSVSVFFSSIVYTGTIIKFSYHIGKFEKKRADEFFSQGVCMAFLIGVGYALILLLLGNPIINRLSASAEVYQYLSKYYYLMLLIVLLNPISILLDNMLIADGSDLLSFVANSAQIVCNIVASVIMVRFWGVTGIALATVISKLLFLGIAVLHFFSKKNTLRFRPRLNLSDAGTIVRCGFVKATTHGFEAILTYLINAFAFSSFGEDALVIVVIIERLLGVLTLFMGLAMACQPLIGTLRGEKNTKALRILMRTALWDMVAVGLVLSSITIIGAPLIVPAFGITEGVLYDQAVLAVRIVSTTLVFHAALVLFFAYYVFISKQLLAFVICLINNLLSFSVMVITLSIILHSQAGMWVGFAAAPVVASAVSALIVIVRYGREVFPFLIRKDRDDRIRIYDFVIGNESAVEIAAVVEQNLKAESVPPGTSVLAGVVTEDMMMLIAEKNADSQKPLRAECTIITEEDGVRVILRDSGVIFDITDTDARADSFRQYIVSNLMLNQDRKLYLTTTGYNRNELFFKH